MAKSKPKKIIKDTAGDETIMLRVDKTVAETLSEKPSGRWDPEYWHPNFQNLLDAMTCKGDINSLGDFITLITYGQVGKRVYSKKGKVRYIQTINLVPTGIDYVIKEAFIEEGSHNDPDRSRLTCNDLLLGNAGMGGLGKVSVFLDENNMVNISQDIDKIQFDGINVFYTAIFLKSRFGQSQIWVRSRGVGAPKLPFDEIKAIKIPNIGARIQNHIEAQYKKMSAYHFKAMEAKRKNSKKAYEKNIKTAEKMLKDLIARTEAVIKGEKDDVI